MRRFIVPIARSRALLLGAVALYACGDETGGERPASVRRVTVQARRELTEGSAAVITHAQPGIVFTINDSGHDAELFAVDTTGRDRGMWFVMNARNLDWEAMSSGPCGDTPPAITDSVVAGEACLTIGDVGDNDARRESRTLYRVREPKALAPGDTGTLVATQLTYRYEDRPHDVEAMVVGPTGDTFLFTKRRRTAKGGRLRPSLVFEIPAAAWTSTTPIVARLVDSLPIVPGSASGRLITDAALSPDRMRVAVRTYSEVYVFVADSTGRPRTDIAPTRCNISSVERGYGEGITWIGTKGELLLTQEGRNAPFHIIACPLPTT